MRVAILPAAVLILWATATPGQSPKATPKAEKLATVTLGKPVENIRLRDAMHYFVNELGIPVEVDSAGIAKGEKPYDDRVVKLARMKDAPAGFAVECLAQAAGATSRKVGGKFVIEAGKPKDLATLLAAPSPKARASAAKLVTFQRPIGLVPLRELLDFVREMHNLEIYLDEVGFQRVKKLQSVSTSPVSQLPPVSTVEKLLTSVVSPLGGKVVVREEMILIVPDGKPGS